MSRNIHNNPYSIFAASIKPKALSISPSKNQALAEMDAEVNAHHQQLLKSTDVISRSKLLRFVNKLKKPLTTETYLQRFIHTFENDPAFADTVYQYDRILTHYQNTKTATAKKISSISKITEVTPALTQQALDRQQLHEALKYCIKNQFIIENTPGSWHLQQHFKAYYFAKVLALWEHYKNNHASIKSTDFPKIISNEVAEDNRQAVVAKQVEAQQNLMNHKMKFSPTRLANQQTKLKEQQTIELNKINTFIPRLAEMTEEIIGFAQQWEAEKIQETLEQAIEEIKRAELAVSSHHPGLFNSPIGQRINPAPYFTNKMDTLSEMKEYRSIFENMLVSIQKAATPSAAPAA